MSFKVAVIAHSHHAIGEPYAGGLEMHTHLLCRTLAKMGAEVTLFAKEGSAPGDYVVEPLVARDFDFHPKPAYSFQWSKQEHHIRNAYNTVLGRISVGAYDAVINNCLNVAPLEWDNDIPMLTVLHTPVLPLLKGPARKAGTNPQREFVSVSAANAVAWREWVPQVHVVNNGIEAGRWKSRVTPTDELRWCARITPEKGLKEAIVAAVMAGRRMKIAGPISNTDYFESAVRPLLGTSIEYVGHLEHSELADFYASGAATLVTPQWEEPFGLVVAESLASGTPLAAFPRGAMSELITGDVGAVSSVCTPESLVDAIGQAVTKDSAVCRRTAAQRFDTTAMVRRYLELLPKPVADSDLMNLCAG